MTNATERICERLEAEGVSFVRSEQIVANTYWGVTWSVGDTKFEFRENDKRADFIAMNATPEQAIAATLGSERDEIYNAGFDNGVKATLQQLEGIMNDKWSSSLTKVENIEEWIAEQWRGYES